MGLPTKRRELKVKKKEINSQFKAGNARITAWETENEGNPTKLQLKSIFGRKGKKIYRKANPRFILRPTKKWRALVRAKRLSKAALIAEKKGSIKIASDYRKQSAKIYEEIGSVKALTAAKKQLELARDIDGANKMQEKINELIKQKKEAKANKKAEE
ncbi:MAG: hypothetical protein JW703_04975 [Candidatus Diapherotrites archaeon]|nr:hypothetical protein [Candidatus Diapherotrites archaeon]